MLALKQKFRVLPLDAVMRIVHMERPYVKGERAIYSNVYSNPEVDQRDLYYRDRGNEYKFRDAAPYDPVGSLGVLKFNNRVALLNIHRYAELNKMKRAVPSSNEGRKHSRQRMEKYQERTEVIDVDEIPIENQPSCSADYRTQNVQVKTEPESLRQNDDQPEKVQNIMSTEKIESQRGGEGLEFQPTPTPTRRLGIPAWKSC